MSLVYSQHAEMQPSATAESYCGDRQLSLDRVDSFVFGAQDSIKQMHMAERKIPLDPWVRAAVHLTRVDSDSSSFASQTTAQRFRAAVPPVVSRQPDRLLRRLNYVTHTVTGVLRGTAEIVILGLGWVRLARPLGLLLIMIGPNSNTRGPWTWMLRLKLGLAFSMQNST